MNLLKLTKLVQFTGKLLHVIIILLQKKPTNYEQNINIYVMNELVYVCPGNTVIVEKKA